MTLESCFPSFMGINYTYIQTVTTVYFPIQPDADMMYLLIVIRLTRIKINQEINGILKWQNIIWKKKKKQRLNWLGHVEHMTEDNNVKKIKRWKPMSKRPSGRPKLRWEDDV
jgi:hypothetical protein